MTIVLYLNRVSITKYPWSFRDVPFMVIVGLLRVYFEYSILILLYFILCYLPGYNLEYIDRLRPEMSQSLWF